MTYEYKCEECEETWELFTTIAKRDDALKEPCPKCGGNKIKRLVSGGAGFSMHGDERAKMYKKAGSGFNDVLKGIKKASGRACTIQTD